MQYNKLNLTSIPDPVFAHTYSCPNYNHKFRKMEPNIEIAYIKTGELLIEMNGEKIKAKENSFLILPHKYEFTIKETKSEPHIHYAISAMVDSQSSLCSDNKEELNKNEIYVPVCIDCGKKTEKMAQLIYDAIKEYQKPSGVGKLKSGINFLHLLCNFYEISLEKDNKKISHTSKTLDKRIKKYIEKNIHTKITLADISDAIGKNANYLNQVFSRENNMPILSYINLLKMKKVAVYIVDYGMSVKAAAQKVGIYDVNYISRLFKQKMGMTISEFKSNSADYTFSLTDKEKIENKTKEIE